MRKIGTYLRSFWQSVCDRPFVYAVFVVTMFISVVCSGSFYRFTKNAIINFENDYYYNVRSPQNIDCQKFYEDIKGSNVTFADLLFSVQERSVVIEGESADIGIKCYKVFTPSTGGFSRKQLDNAQKVVKLSYKLATLLGKKAYDKFEILGEQFIVTSIGGDITFYELFIPGTIDIVNDASAISNTTHAGLTKEEMTCSLIVIECK